MYYPDQRHVANLTIIRKVCLLPEQAIGSVRINQNARVDIHDSVAHGVIPAKYHILDALRFFKLRKPQALESLLLVEPQSVVKEKDVLAGKKPDRGKRLFSPVNGVVVAITDGRIILQEMPEVIDLKAGVRGRVIQVYPDRGVSIETVGARVQGVWGNNRNAIATLRLAPDGGIESIPADSIGDRYSGVALLTRQPITEKVLRIVEVKKLAGIIAPSMDADLIDRALKMSAIVLLTEGFGNTRMGHVVYTLLEEFEGQQITLDARRPDRWDARVPEIIINIVPPENERPSRPNVMLTLREGLNARITRAPYAGLTGTIVALPKTPILLDNGLRILCAQVELVVGETVFVPLANLEVLGR